MPKRFTDKDNSLLIVPVKMAGVRWWVIYDKKTDNHLQSIQRDRADGELTIEKLLAKIEVTKIIKRGKLNHG